MAEPRRMYHPKIVLDVVYGLEQYMSRGAACQRTAQIMEIPLEHVLDVLQTYPYIVKQQT